MTSFRKSNQIFVDAFIECVAWSSWWTWCVLPIICNSKQFSFFAFYFNVSNKISSTPPRLLNFQFPKTPPSPFIPTPAPPSLNSISRLILICKILYWSSLFLFYTFQTFYASFDQKSIWHFGVAWLISHYFSCKDLKPVVFIVCFLKSKKTKRRKNIKAHLSKILYIKTKKTLIRNDRTKKKNRSKIY